MKVLVFLFGILVLCSCKKVEDRSCLKFAGEEAEREVVILENIDTLNLQDDIYYTLIEANETKVVLTGGENLLNHVNIEYGNGKLTMQNENKCNFLRSYKNKITAKLYVDSLTFIEYQGSKTLVSQDTLRSNELRVKIIDGAGTTDLTVSNGYTSITVNQGYADFVINGRTLYGHFHCNSASYCDATNLSTAHELVVKSNTVGKMLINAEGTKLIADIKNRGNIEYFGNPVLIDLNKVGSGELINLNN